MTPISCSIPHYIPNGKISRPIPGCFPISHIGTIRGQMNHTVCSIPVILAGIPGQVAGERGKQEVDSPRDDHDVVDVRVEAGDDRAPAQALEQWADCPGFRATPRHHLTWNKVHECAYGVI